MQPSTRHNIYSALKASVKVFELCRHLNLLIIHLAAKNCCGNPLGLIFMTVAASTSLALCMESFWWWRGSMPYGWPLLDPLC